MNRIRRGSLCAPALVIAAWSCFAQSLAAQRDIATGLIALRQAARDATNDRLVAIVGSHPDDHWMLPAAYLRFHLGFRVAVILFTRGEGGQNITGPEVGDELGRIRTRETEASADVLDCEVWYLNRTDGGFCRSAQDALASWGRRGTIEDLARIFRTLRPEIVLTMHSPTDTHGHDLGLLDVLPDAVDLAMSPEFAIDGEPPPRIHRLLRGAGNDRPELSLAADTVDVERGLTYRAIAYAAFHEHRSQAPFRPLDDLFDPEIRLVSMPLVGERPPPNLHEGIPTVFDGLRGRVPPSEREALRAAIEVGLSAQLGNRHGVRALALDLRRRLLAIDAGDDIGLRRRIARRVEALERVARHAIGFGASVEVDPSAVAVPGEPISLRVRTRFEAHRIEDMYVESEGAGELVVDDFDASTTTADIRATLTLPPHLDPTASNAYLSDTYVPPLSLAIGFRVRGTPGDPTDVDTDLRVRVPVPIRIRPAIELEVLPAKILVPDGVNTVDFAVRVRRNTTVPLDEVLAVRSSLGVQPLPLSHQVVMTDERLREYPFRLSLPPDASTMKARIRLGEWSAELPLYRVEVRIPTGLRVGLVKGVDDTARSILVGLGAEVIELTDNVLPTRDLSDLDTIVVDIRALRDNINAAARAGFNRFLDFVRDGGRLVVFYHKDQEFNLASSGFRGHPAELPLHIGKGRVTHEDAPVEMLLPDHPLLRSPNRIRPGDWDGWVQERGLYFPDDYSEQFDELLAMSDAGHPTERGALIYGRAGRGEYVYCALSLYRQLKNLHPGACRLFANLVSRERD